MLHSEHGSFARRTYHLPRISLCVRSRSRGCSIHATSDTLVASGLDRRVVSKIYSLRVLTCH